MQLLSSSQREYPGFSLGTADETSYNEEDRNDDINKNYELRVSEAVHKLRKSLNFPNLNSCEPPYFCSVKCVLQVDEYQFVGPPL